MGIGAWENFNNLQESICIAVPHTGLTLFEWGVGAKILQPPVPFTMISNKGLPIDRARCDLVEQAQKMGASHIFFLDSDVILPSDGLVRLWNRRLPIVAGIYGSKHGAPAIWIEQAESGQARYAAVSSDFMEKAELFTHPKIVTGAGCCLIDMNVFKRLKEPFFEWTQGREKNGVSEDFYFFEKCRAAGIPIHIDMTVRCFHGEYAMRNWKGELQRLMPF